MRNNSHQCGLQGCRVGEASNPGPVQTRKCQAFAETQLDCESGSLSSAAVASARSRRGDSPNPPSRSVYNARFRWAEPTSCEEVWFSGRGQERAQGRPWQFRGTGSVDSKTSQVVSRVSGGGDSKQVRCSESSRRGPCPGSEAGSLLQEGRKMSATQNPQPVSKRLLLTSRGSAVDSPPATVVDA